MKANYSSPMLTVRGRIVDATAAFIDGIGDPRNPMKLQGTSSSDLGFGL